MVVATDNMDCFSDSLPRIRPLHGRVNGVLCSSDLGVLKAESPERFFGGWLKEHGLTPAQAVLVDDSRRNCDRFERFGGAAIHYDGRVPATLRELKAWAAGTASESSARASHDPRTATSAGTSAWRWG